MRNSRCGVSVKEARKEWHPPKEVLNSANIEGRDRRGLVQLPSSIGLHGARGLKVQISYVVAGSCPDPGVDVSNLKKYVKLGINLTISKNVTFPS